MCCLRQRGGSGTFGVSCLSISHPSSLPRPRIKDLICHWTFFFFNYDLWLNFHHLWRKPPFSDFHSIFKIQTFTVFVLHRRTYTRTFTDYIFKVKCVNMDHLRGFLKGMYMCVLGNELFYSEHKVIRPMGNHGSKPRWTLIFLDHEIHILERATYLQSTPFFFSKIIF